MDIIKQKQLFIFVFRTVFLLSLFKKIILLLEHQFKEEGFYIFYV